MGPALSPPCGLLHASTDEAVCEPEGRPTARQRADDMRPPSRGPRRAWGGSAEPRLYDRRLAPRGRFIKSWGKPCGKWRRRPPASRRIRRPALRRRGSCWRTVEEAAVYAAERGD